jgi:hypothetical protein
MLQQNLASEDVLIPLKSRDNFTSAHASILAGIRMQKPAKEWQTDLANLLLLFSSSLLIK